GARLYSVAPEPTLGRDVCRVPTADSGLHLCLMEVITVWNRTSQKNRTSQEEGLAPARPSKQRRGQAPLPDLFYPGWFCLSTALVLDFVSLHSFEPVVRRHDLHHDRNRTHTSTMDHS